MSGISRKQASMASSQARVSAHGCRDPGKPAWAEHFSHGGEMILSANHSSCLVFTNAFDRVLIFMRFWKADPHSWNCKGCCQPIMFLSCAVIGCKVDLPKYGQLINHQWGQCQKVFSSGWFARVSATTCWDPGLWGWASDEVYDSKTQEMSNHPNVMHFAYLVMSIRWLLMHKNEIVNYRLKLRLS